MLALPVQIEDAKCINCGRSETLHLYMQLSQLYAVEGVPEREVEKPPIRVGTTLKERGGSPLQAKWLPISGRCEHRSCLTTHRGAIRLDKGRVMGLVPGCLTRYSDDDKSKQEKDLSAMVKQALGRMSGQE